MGMLKQALPNPRLPFRVAHRRAGLGSLGRQRFTAIADWCGSKVAREAKALLPSACVWASATRDSGIYYSQIVDRAVRGPDPFLNVNGGWILRRLSPYCSRIELSQLPRTRDEEKLMRAMGWELGNVHLGSQRAVSRVLRDLGRRKTKWLGRATEIMAEATVKDWKEWRKTV